MSEVRTYTIDLRLEGGSCHWKLYKVGGSILVGDGEADTLEQASADARTAMIVEHRKDPPRSETVAERTGGER